MKSFAELSVQLNESAPTSYWWAEGDRYDGGVTAVVYIDGTKVHAQTMDGEEDHKYKKKEYKDIQLLIKAIAKDHGVSASDIKHVKSSSVRKAPIKRVARGGTPAELAASAKARKEIEASIAAKKKRRAARGE